MSVAIFVTHDAFFGVTSIESTMLSFFTDFPFARSTANFENAYPVQYGEYSSVENRRPLPTSFRKMPSTETKAMQLELFVQSACFVQSRFCRSATLIAGTEIVSLRP